MLLLVALAAALGLVVFSPPFMIVKYLRSGPVLVFLLGYLAVIAAPFLYAWRTRPFRDEG